jgi:hypothetical protein
MAAATADETRFIFKTKDIFEARVGVIARPDSKFLH